MLAENVLGEIGSTKKALLFLQRTIGFVPRSIVPELQLNSAELAQLRVFLL
jgi:hypothetical protein